MVGEYITEFFLTLDCRDDRELGTFDISMILRINNLERRASVYALLLCFFSGQ